jgi:hypothetical protein
MKFLKTLLILLLPSAALAMEDQPAKKAEEENVYQPETLIQQNIKVVANQILNLAKQQWIIDALLEEVEDEQSGEQSAQETIENMESLFTALRNLAETSTDKKIIETIITQIQQYRSGKIGKEVITHQGSYAIAQLQRLPEPLRVSVLETILQQLPKQQIWADAEHTIPTTHTNLVGEQPLLTEEIFALQNFFDELLEKITETEKSGQISKQYADEQRKELAQLLLKYQNVFHYTPLLIYSATSVVSLDEHDPEIKSIADRLKILAKYTPNDVAFDALYHLALHIVTTPEEYEEQHKETIERNLKIFELLLKLGISPLVSNQENKSFGTLLHEWKELDTLPIQYQRQTFIYSLNKKLIDRMLKIMEKVKTEKEEEHL